MSGDWYMRPDVMAGLDIAVLAALAVAIIVGLRLSWRLKALRRTHAQWNAELAAFTEKTDVVEANFERLRAMLLAEAADRRAQAIKQEAVALDLMPEQKAQPAPSLEACSAKAPVHRPPVTRRRLNAVLSMQ